MASLPYHTTIEYYGWERSKALIPTKPRQRWRTAQTSLYGIKQHFVCPNSSWAMDLFSVFCSRRRHADPLYIFASLACLLYAQLVQKCMADLTDQPVGRVCQTFLGSPTRKTMAASHCIEGFSDHYRLSYSPGASYYSRLSAGYWRRRLGNPNVPRILQKIIDLCSAFVLFLTDGCREFTKGEIWQYPACYFWLLSRLSTLAKCNVRQVLPKNEGRTQWTYWSCRWSTLAKSK